MNRSISIIWEIDDVKDADDELSDLTDSECCEVLALAQDNYDSNIGINWNVIRCYIDQIKQKRTA